MSFKDDMTQLASDRNLYYWIGEAIQTRANKGYRFWTSGYDYTFDQSSLILDWLASQGFTKFRRDTHYDQEYYSIHVAW